MPFDVFDVEKGKDYFLELLQNCGLDMDKWIEYIRVRTPSEEKLMTFTFDTDKMKKAVIIKMWFDVVKTEVDIVDPEMKEMIEKGKME
jgi:hypothetical protein